MPAIRAGAARSALTPHIMTGPALPDMPRSHTRTGAEDGTRAPSAPSDAACCSPARLFWSRDTMSRPHTPRRAHGRALPATYSGHSQCIAAAAAVSAQSGTDPSVDKSAQRALLAFRAPQHECVRSASASRAARSASCGAWRRSDASCWPVPRTRWTAPRPFRGSCSRSEIRDSPTDRGMCANAL